MKLLIGPPASGKTEHLLDIAIKACKDNKLVWWIGLPNQRDATYRRATKEGAVLGLEFLSQQQLYYRLLAFWQQLKNKPMVGTRRISLVGEVLSKIGSEVANQQADTGTSSPEDDFKRIPTPGEARLFSVAIAEAKRFGLTSEDIPNAVEDAETRRFARVFKKYEEAQKAKESSDALNSVSSGNEEVGEWDFDDFRTATLNYLKANTTLDPKEDLEPDLIIIDGFRETGPSEVAIYQELAKHCELWLSLPTEPPELKATKELTEPYPTTIKRYRATNPIAESRWVLRSLKRDLAEQKLKPLDIAVILPQRSIKAFLSLADEYQIPLMDESPRALSDTIGGNLLLDLLELPDYPTASKLLAIPKLQPLARAALDKGIAGKDAIGQLALELSQKEETAQIETDWQKWLKTLEVTTQPLQWASDIVEEIPLLLGWHKNEDEDKDYSQDLKDWEKHKELLLRRAKEAEHIINILGKEDVSVEALQHFRAWWAGLIKESFQFNKPNGGIALLSDRLVSGRRFKKVYLMSATEGSYTIGESEDYFVTEELRQELDAVFSGVALPKRFQGRDEMLFAELLSRGDEVIVTCPEASQGGQLVPELALVGDVRPEPLPDVPAGSQLELVTNSHFEADLGALELGTISLERLKKFDECAFQYWAEDRVLEDSNLPRWSELISKMRGYKKLNAARIENLKADFPEAAHWLEAYKEELVKFTFGLRLPDEGNLHAYIDAVYRSGGEASLYRFSAPTTETTGIHNAEEAEDYLKKRWNEMWAAGYLLENYQGRIHKVKLYVWPVLSAPIDVMPKGIEYVWRQIATKQTKARKAFRNFQAGKVDPNPGFRCRECKVSDLCRVAQK